MENKEIIDLIVKCVFAVVSVIVTTYIIPLLKSYIESQKLDDLMIFIEKCVQSAEKLYTPEEWKIKKDYVRQLALNKLNSLGIEMTAESLDALIEGFVKEVKG